MLFFKETANPKSDEGAPVEPEALPLTDEQLGEVTGGRGGRHEPPHILRSLTLPKDGVGCGHGGDE